jgi:hypothetical protein
MLIGKKCKTLTASASLLIQTLSPCIILVRTATNLKLYTPTYRKFPLPLPYSQTHQRPTSQNNELAQVSLPRSRFTLPAINADQFHMNEVIHKPDAWKPRHWNRTLVMDPIGGHDSHVHEAQICTWMDPKWLNPTQMNLRIAPRQIALGSKYVHLALDMTTDKKKEEHRLPYRSHDVPRYTLIIGEWVSSISLKMKKNSPIWSNIPEEYSTVFLRTWTILMKPHFHIIMVCTHWGMKILLRPSLFYIAISTTL